MRTLKRPSRCRARHSVQRVLPVLRGRGDPDPARRRRWGIEDGLYIQSVDPSGSAAKAGLRPGDIVTKIDGRPAARTDVLTQLVFTKKAGDRVQITYLRDGGEHTVTATLVAQP